jgi:AcrR family transcriptional regulator
MAQQRSEITRTQIMNAAMDHFCRSGYDAASVSEICKTAGVSKGAFYHHFPSKKALFLALTERWLQELDAQMRSFQTLGKSVPQSMLDMADMIGSIFNVASGQLPMFMEFLIQASRDEVIWDAAIAPFQAYQDRFAGMIREGIAEGSIHPGTDAQTVASVLISFAVGVILQGVVMPESADWEAVMKKGMKIMIENMQIQRD